MGTNPWATWNFYNTWGNLIEKMGQKLLPKILTYKGILGHLGHSLEITTK
nr:MAG TPA: hypothetical protein [Caudoviricetes sp.]